MRCTRISGRIARCCWMCQSRSAPNGRVRDAASPIASSRRPQSSSSACAGPIGRLPPASRSACACWMPAQRRRSCSRRHSGRCPICCRAQHPSLPRACMVRAEPPEGADAQPAAGAGGTHGLEQMLSDAPWLAGPLAHLRRARSAGRFPAALLIQDQPGAGGAALARFAVRLALCRSAQPPCGQCRDCRQLAAAQHPDYLHVAPMEESRQIRVEQIRELAELLALSAHAGAATVALSEPADAMNANAANALLKTLEEPRAGVSLLLVTAVPSRLAATILSRCQRLLVPRPSRAASLAWLTRQAGAGPWEAVLEVIGNAPFDALSLEAAQVARLGVETHAALADLAAGRLDVARTAEAWGRADSLELRLTCLENWLTSRIDSAAR